ncbi:MAG: hypothetical protein Q8K99_08105, partial [Actinomycetota bacterium]|nr:hypothetical protein [Actinomycetota bacterium]
MSDLNEGVDLPRSPADTPGADDSGDRPATVAPPSPDPLPPGAVPGVGAMSGRERGRSRIWVVIGVIVAFIIIASGLAFWLAKTYIIDPLVDSGSDSWVAPVDSSARWTADGKFAVIQTQNAAGTPFVAVWDSESGDVRTQEGFLVATVEKAAPVVWLVRATADDVAEAVTEEDVFVPGAGPFDSPPRELLAWALDEPDSVPSADVPAKWRAMPGPADWVAYCEIDPLRGAFPAKMLFNNAASSGEGHKAALPEGFGTFSVVGWSPSGAYLAIEELAQMSEAAQMAPDSSDDMPWDSPERRLIVLDAASGDAVASVLLTGGASGPVMWDSTRDVLIWVEQQWADESDSGQPNNVVRAIEPGGEVSDAADVLGLKVPEEWKNAWSLEVLGTGPNGVLLAAEAEGSGKRLYLIGKDGGVTDTGSIGWAISADWEERTGLLVLEETYGDDD